MRPDISTINSITGRVADTRFLSKHQRHFIKSKKGTNTHAAILYEPKPGVPQVRIGYIHRPKTGGYWSAVATFEGRLHCLGENLPSRQEAGQMVADYYVFSQTG